MKHNMKLMKPRVFIYELCLTRLFHEYHAEDELKEAHELNDTVALVESWLQLSKALKIVES